MMGRDASVATVIDRREKGEAMSEAEGRVTAIRGAVEEAGFTVT